MPTLDRRLWSRILTCCALVTTLAILAPRAESAQPRHLPFVDSGTVTYTTVEAAVDLDPASMGIYIGNLMVTRETLETLIQYNGPDVNHFVPLLATSWTSTADDAVWTFHLRHGVRFHTGRCCMTADDVRYSIARTVAAKQAMAYLFTRYFSDPFKQIKVLDPYTVQFGLGRPQHTFIRAIASKFAGLIEDARALRAHATKSDPWAHNWATDHDAGTGPYMLQSWQRGQQVILTRFGAYWRGWGGPHFSTVIIRTVSEGSTRRELMERGQTDVTFGLTPQDDLALEQNPAVKVVAPYGSEVEYIVMTEAGPLASPYARQALAYAFNYDAYLAAAFHGFARRSYSLLPSMMVGSDPRVFKYQTDLARARALLNKAGVRPGATLSYMFESGTTWQRVAGLIMQAQLAQIGLTLKLQEVSPATFSAIYYGTEPPSKRPNLIGMFWWPDYNDPYDMAVVLLASYTAGPNGANGGYYHNARVDALLGQLQYDAPEKLRSDAARLQDVSTRVDPAIVPLNEPAQVTILAKNLHGYVFNPLDLQTYDFYAMYRS